MWVPGHCGIPGNEIADSLAKMAKPDNRDRDVGQVSRKTVNTCVSFADICQHLRAHYDHVWNARYQSNPKGTSFEAISIHDNVKKTCDLSKKTQPRCFGWERATANCTSTFCGWGSTQMVYVMCAKYPKLFLTFLLICPKYRAQRETLLAILKNMGRHY